MYQIYREDRKTGSIRGSVEICRLVPVDVSSTKPRPKPSWARAQYAIWPPPGEACGLIHAAVRSTNVTAPARHLSTPFPSRKYKSPPDQTDIEPVDSLPTKVPSSLLTCKSEPPTATPSSTQETYLPSGENFA